MSQDKGIGSKVWSAYKKHSGLGPILELAETSIKSASTAIKTNDEKELSMEAIKQEFQARINQANARTQQEIAIARRIEEADEVEIEEYYGVEVSANAGLNVDADKISVGLSGDGRKVTKRVYKFRRTTSSTDQDIINQE
mgnify:CR=1 FL=1